VPLVNFLKIIGNHLFKIQIFFRKVTKYLFFYMCQFFIASRALQEICVHHVNSKTFAFQGMQQKLNSQSICHMY